jgi:hypothetical protein
MKNRLPKNPLTVPVLAALLLGLAVPVRAEVEVVPYAADGYRYRAYPELADVPADWASPEFDDLGLADGAMPFGSWELGGATCPLAAEASTPWPSPSTLLVRRVFALPRGAAGVRVHLGVDNNALVAVNGNLLAPDWTRHEYCPARDEFVFDVPAAFLHRTGPNVLAVLAYDAGVESWIDVRLTASERSPLR